MILFNELYLNKKTPNLMVPPLIHETFVIKQIKFDNQCYSTAELGNVQFSFEYKYTVVSLNIPNFVFICVNTFCMFCVGWTWAWSSGSWPSRWAPNPWGSQGGPGGRSLRGPWGGSSSRPWGTARQGKFTR